MIVERIETPGGSHIEPPLNPLWSHLKKLRWHAAVASVDTGLTVRVEPTRKLMPQTYMVSIVGYSSHSDRPYKDAWTLINGISSGARAVRDQS